MGTIKIVNLKDLGSGGGQEIQVFPAADGTQTDFVITDFIPGSTLVVKVNGIEWSSGWAIVGDILRFEYPPRDGAIVSIENAI